MLCAPLQKQVHSIYLPFRRNYQICRSGGFASIQTILMTSLPSGIFENEYFLFSEHLSSKKCFPRFSHRFLGSSIENITCAHYSIDTIIKCIFTFSQKNLSKPANRRFRIHTSHFDGIAFLGKCQESVFVVILYTQYYFGFYILFFIL